MRELETSQEFNNQEPFVIRAHHLVTFRKLLQRYPYWGFLYNLDPVLSPKELAEQVRLTAENYKSEYMDSQGIEYSIDVLGTSPETANKNTEQSQKTFETFLSLPDNHSVEITEGVLDNICKGCVIGAHCRLKGNFEEDCTYLDAFIKAIDFIYPKKPRVSKEKVYFLDSKKTQKVRKVRTTMGVVKNVLATRPFEISDAHSTSIWELLKLSWGTIL